MSSPKKKPSSDASKLAALVRSPARPLLLAALLTVALVGTWSAVWYGSGVREFVLSSSDYELTAEHIEITPLPGWIHSDIQTEVLRSATLDGRLSILDDDLTQRIAHAFSLHPWVAKVHQVSKHHPARVKVELTYRRPVCMVAVPGGLFPVDVHGVLLPCGDFSPVEASRYPRLVGIDTAPLGTLGESWGDARVVGGAEIADAVGPLWEEWKLAQIVPSDKPLSTAGEFTYTLMTRGGTSIRFGRAPGAKAPGELPPEEKIARLKEYLAQHGTLEGRDGPQELDVHDLAAPRLSARAKQ